MTRDRLKLRTRSDIGAPLYRARLGIGLTAALGLAASLAACEGCHATKPQTASDGATTVGSAAPAANLGPSTLRFYIVSDLAGALEPCGCVKDQLGGLDHAAAWIASESKRNASGASALVTAGPLFFLDPVLEPERRSQEVAKAETLAASLKRLGLAAFAPGRNDWAAGANVLNTLVTKSGGALVFGNAKADASTFANIAPAPYVVREMNGVKVAFIGVSRPDADKEAPAVPGLEVTSAVDAVRAAAAAAKKEGANVMIALASVGRGEGKRIADAVPTLTAVVVGSPGHGGDMNTKTPPFDAVENVIIAETGNHLQTVVVLDLFVRDASFSFANAATAPPAKGSFFRYAVKEIREGMGRDPALSETLLAYYKHVNDENRRELAGRKPRPVAPGQSSYVGVDACASCHADARAFWQNTKHAGAYATLSSQFKEFNLDCVSCHVTGYDRPGGSTVTHVDGLADVQCEVCHGPGSAHVKSGGSKAKIVGHPKTEMCLECHHPPHVNEFDANAKVAEIVGPGHGRPMK